MKYLLQEIPIRTIILVDYHPTTLDIIHFAKDKSLSGNISFLVGPMAFFLSIIEVFCLSITEPPITGAAFQRIDCTSENGVIARRDFISTRATSSPPPAHLVSVKIPH